MHYSVNPWRWTRPLLSQTSNRYAVPRVSRNVGVCGTVALNFGRPAANEAEFGPALSMRFHQPFQHTRSAGDGFTSHTVAPVANSLIRIRAISGGIPRIKSM